MKKLLTHCLLTFFTILLIYNIGNAQTQANDIDASLNNLGGGQIEVVFTPNVAVSGIGNPLNIYLKIPEAEASGTTFTIDGSNNPFGLSAINDFADSGFQYYFFQGQPAVNLSAWTVDTPVSIATFTVAGPATDITLSGGDFAPIFTGSGYFWPGTSISNNNTEMNLVTWPIDAIVSLPVELTAFNAQKIGKNDALLFWETDTEINSSHFEIERSVDGRNWELMHSLDAAGNSQTTKRYEYMDKGVYQSKSKDHLFYYRLRIVDFDNSFEYSDIKSVLFEKSNSDADLILFPNPAKDRVQLILPYADSNSNVHLVMINVNGQVIDSQEIMLDGQSYELSLGSAIASGIYILKAQNELKIVSQILIIE